ncbi:hypothetical protein [Vibrio marinisediminis]|nr:hypothetical protein [Vibrio marinisediminis]
MQRLQAGFLPALVILGEIKFLMLLDTQSLYRSRWKTPPAHIN